MGTIEIKDPGIIAKFATYPNPVIEHLNLRRQQNNKATFEIYNSTGTLVKKSDVYGSSQIIDVSKLTSGAYMINLNENGITFSQRFFKQ